MLEIALAIPRVLVGLLMVGHGLQKLTGAFGGPGLAGWAGALDGMGIRPGRVWAPIVAFAETVGGALLALGLFGPIGSLLVAADLAVAILVVHLARGLWSQNGGYEYPLVLIAVAVAAAIAGPVDWTLDRVLGTSLSVELSVAATVVVAVVALAALVVRQRALRPALGQPTGHGASA